MGILEKGKQQVKAIHHATGTWAHQHANTLVCFRRKGRSCGTGIPMVVNALHDDDV